MTASRSRAMKSRSTICERRTRVNGGTAFATRSPVELTKISPSVRARP